MNLISQNIPKRNETHFYKSRYEDICRTVLTNEKFYSGARERKSFGNTGLRNKKKTFKSSIEIINRISNDLIILHIYLS